MQLQRHLGATWGSKIPLDRDFGATLGSKMPLERHFSATWHLKMHLERLFEATMRSKCCLSTTSRPLCTRNHFLNLLVSTSALRNTDRACLQTAVHSQSLFKITAQNHCSKSLFKITVSALLHSGPLYPALPYCAWICMGSH